MRNITLVVALAATVAANAQVITAQGGNAALQNFALEGNTQYDGFTTLSAADNPGRGGFPGTTMWAPIESNLGGDAQLVKIANGPGGGPYPASGSIYYGGFSSEVNYNGGTLAVADATVVDRLSTVILQIQIGEAWTYDLWNREGAVLNYNGGSQRLAATYSALLGQNYNGTVTMPTGEEDIFINNHGFQWDLSGIAEPITSISLEFTAVQHAQLYALQLDQTDHVYNTQVVPEPASMVALALGAAAALKRRQRKA